MTTTQRYHKALIFLHWLLAVLIIFALVAGSTLDGLPNSDPDKVNALRFHMIGGLLIGLLMLTRALAVELGPDHIRVNALAPGLIRTRFSQALWEAPDIAGRAVAATPLGRLGEPEDIVGAALFLASPQAAYITGAVLTLDGGLTESGGLG